MTGWTDAARKAALEARRRNRKFFTPLGALKGIKRVKRLDKRPSHIYFPTTVDRLIRSARARFGPTGGSKAWAATMSIRGVGRFAKASGWKPSPRRKAKRTHHI